MTIHPEASAAAPSFPARSALSKTREGAASLNLLTIGNSFSDDAMDYVWPIARALGFQSVHLGNLYIGGCPLSLHVENAREDKDAYEYRVNTAGMWETTPHYRMRAAVESEHWDVISLQQASGYSGLAGTYADADYLIRYVQALSPSAAIAWHMTWAYAQNSTHPHFAHYGNSQLRMYQSILEAVQKNIAADSRIAKIIPCGTAIQNARTSYLGDTLTRDGFHLRIPLGRYIAGLTMVRTLCGLSLENLAYAPEGVTAGEKAVAIEAAEQACCSPWAVTRSRYTEAPAGAPMS